MTTPSVLAFAERPLHASVTFGRDTRDIRSWGQLGADVRRVSALLEGARGGSVVLWARDRYLFTVGLLAAWNAGLVVALPPNGRPETIEGLAAGGDVAALLHDGGWSGLELHAGIGGLLAAPPEPALRHAPDKPLVVVYTSGSTGAPMPHLKTAGQLLGEAAALCDLFGLGGARIASTAPAHHLYGLLFSVVVPLVSGGAFARATPLFPSAVVDAADGADVLVSVPAHLESLAEVAAGSLGARLRVFSSGAPLPRETAAAWTARHGGEIVEVLGSSETGGIATRAGESPWAALPGVRVEADDEGALLVDSPFLAPAAPRPYRTNERVSVVGPGCFHHLGRGDAVVKVGGERVNVAAVEATLRAMTGVSDAAVLAVATGGSRQHELWAAVVAPQQTAVSLRAHLLRSLDPVAVPRRLRFVDQLPRAALGKLPRAELEALFAEDGGALRVGDS